MHTNVILTNIRCTHAQSNYTSTKLKAWFRHLLRHLASKQSGSILHPSTLLWRTAYAHTWFNAPPHGILLSKSTQINEYYNQWQVTKQASAATNNSVRKTRDKIQHKINIPIIKIQWQSKKN